MSGVVILLIIITTLGGAWLLCYVALGAWAHIKTNPVLACISIGASCLAPPLFIALSIYWLIRSFDRDQDDRLLAYYEDFEKDRSNA